MAFVGEYLMLVKVLACRKWKHCGCWGFVVVQTHPLSIRSSSSFRDAISWMLCQLNTINDPHFMFCFCFAHSMYSCAKRYSIAKLGKTSNSCKQHPKLKWIYLILHGISSSVPVFFVSSETYWKECTGECKKNSKLKLRPINILIAFPSKVVTPSRPLSRRSAWLPILYARRHRIMM